MQKNDIFMICASGNSKVFVELLEGSDDKSTLLSAKDSDGKSLLEIAACFGCLNIIEELVKYGLTVDATSERGYSLLHWSACWGYIDIIKYLCRDMIVDISQKNIYGETAKQMALRYNKDSCALLLDKYELLTSLKNCALKYKQIASDPDKHMWRFTKDEKLRINRFCDEKIEWIKHNQEMATLEQVAEKQHDLEQQLNLILHKLK